MKILKLLNKRYLSILLSILFLQPSYSEEPVDIWNLKKKSDTNKIENSEIIDLETVPSSSIFEILDEKQNEIEINEETNFISKDINISGIYDPSDNDVSIYMWIPSNGSKILEIIDKINKVNLSKDAVDILNIALLTNSYFPKKNINKEEFLKIKSDWLIKNQDFSLIKNYLEKNVILANESNLLTYYADHHLSNSDIAQACVIFNKINLTDFDNYTAKYKIYCLINSNKNEEAQLLYDLLKENGFEDNFFDKKFSYLMGYEENLNSEISEKTLLDFHLSHRTNLDFKFEPNSNTSKLIWRYLSSSNLLESTEFVDIEDKEKVFIIEKATNDKNYKEDDLFLLYERFMFNINQLLTINETYKLLPNSEARALIYQGILLNNDSSEKIQLIKLLKESFVRDKIPNAFEIKLSEFLKEIDKEEIPSNYTSFYELNIKNVKKNNKKIKFNNEIIHQSKLLNYFKEDINKKKFEKDLENLLKKIKKNKKYFFSTKDIILLESLKSDGIQIPKKYEKLYEVTEPNIPYDIQIMINRDEIGLALLRLVEIIGEDEVLDMGSETLYFIISILNQFNIDKLRNEILLKVLPLKV